MKLKRSIATSVLVTFLATHLFSNQGYALSEPLKTPPVEFPKKIGEIRIPESMGKIQDSFQGSSPKSVIILQDAHSIPEAQKSIHRLISFFQKKHGVNLVALEGAGGKLDPQIFRSFPDQKRLRKFLHQYLKSGELTGSTAAAIFGKQPGVFHGVEDWELYDEGLKIYLAALEQEETLRLKLDVWSKELIEKKKEYYSKELLQVDQLSQNFGNDQVAFLDILKQLATVKKPEKNSAVGAMLQLLDSVQDNHEQEKFLKKISEKIKRHLESRPRAASQLSKLHEQVQNYQTSKITAAEFAFALKIWLQSHLPASKEDIEKLSVISSAYQKLQSAQDLSFLKELDAYVRSIKESLFQNQIQKNLDQETHELNLIQKLVKLELSREEWNGVKSHPVTQLLAHQKITQEDLKVHLAFYENAEKRDQVFLDNLQKLWNSKSAGVVTQGAALLIAGGFHAEGLTQRLKEKNISYILIMPAVASIPKETHYREQMQGNVSWKSYFKEEDGQIHLYDAFVRALRDKLLRSGPQSTVNSPQNKLNLEDSNFVLGSMDYGLAKLWRDQIIHDLASQKQIERAGEYTRFLDEMLEGRGSKVEGKSFRLAQLDRFIAGLQHLKATNRITTENIFNILRTGTMSPKYLAVLDPTAQGTESLTANALPFETPRSEARNERITGSIEYPEEAVQYPIMPSGEEFDFKLYIYSLNLDRENPPDNKSQLDVEKIKNLNKAFRSNLSSKKGGYFLLGDEEKNGFLLFGRSERMDTEVFKKVYKTDPTFLARDKNSKEPNTFVIEYTVPPSWGIDPEKLQKALKAIEMANPGVNLIFVRKKFEDTGFESITYRPDSEKKGYFKVEIKTRVRPETPRSEMRNPEAYQFERTLPGGEKFFFDLSVKKKYRMGQGFSIEMSDQTKKQLGWLDFFVDKDLHNYNLNHATILQGKGNGYSKLLLESGFLVLREGFLKDTPEDISHMGAAMVTSPFMVKNLIEYGFSPTGFSKENPDFLFYLGERKSNTGKLPVFIDSRTSPAWGYLEAHKNALEFFNEPGNLRKTYFGSYKLTDLNQFNQKLEVTKAETQWDAESLSEWIEKRISEREESSRTPIFARSEVREEIVRFVEEMMARIMESIQEMSLETARNILIAGVVGASLSMFLAWAHHEDYRRRELEDILEALNGDSRFLRWWSLSLKNLEAIQKAILETQRESRSAAQRWIEGDGENDRVGASRDAAFKAFDAFMGIIRANPSLLWHKKLIEKISRMEISFPYPKIENFLLALQENEKANQDLRNLARELLSERRETEISSVVLKLFPAERSEMRMNDEPKSLGTEEIEVHSGEVFRMGSTAIQFLIREAGVVLQYRDPLLQKNVSYSLPIGKTRIGRNDNQGIRILDEKISRVHAEVTVTNNGIKYEVKLRDVGSSNGTFRLPGTLFPQEPLSTITYPSGVEISAKGMKGETPNAFPFFIRLLPHMTIDVEMFSENQIRLVVHQTDTPQQSILLNGGAPAWVLNRGVEGFLISEANRKIISRGNHLTVQFDGKTLRLETDATNPPFFISESRSESRRAEEEISRSKELERRILDMRPVLKKTIENGSLDFESLARIFESIQNKADRDLFPYAEGYDWQIIGEGFGALAELHWYDLESALRQWRNIFEELEKSQLREAYAFRIKILFWESILIGGLSAFATAMLSLIFFDFPAIERIILGLLMGFIFGYSVYFPLAFKNFKKYEREKNKPFTENELINLRAFLATSPAGFSEAKDFLLTQPVPEGEVPMSALIETIQKGKKIVGNAKRNTLDSGTLNSEVYAFTYDSKIIRVQEEKEFENQILERQSAIISELRSGNQIIGYQIVWRRYEGGDRVGPLIFNIMKSPDNSNSFEEIRFALERAKLRSETRAVYDIRETLSESFKGTTQLIYRQKPLREAIAQSTSPVFFTTKPFKIQFRDKASNLWNGFSTAPEVKVNGGEGLIEIYVHPGPKNDELGKAMADSLPQIIKLLESALQPYRPSAAAIQESLEQKPASKDSQRFIIYSPHLNKNDFELIRPHLDKLFVQLNPKHKIVVLFEAALPSILKTPNLPFSLKEVLWEKFSSDDYSDNLILKDVMGRWVDQRNEDRESMLQLINEGKESIRSLKSTFNSEFAAEWFEYLALKKEKGYRIIIELESVHTDVSLKINRETIEFIKVTRALSQGDFPGYKKSFKELELITNEMMVLRDQRLFQVQIPALLNKDSTFIMLRGSAHFDAEKAYSHMPFEVLKVKDSDMRLNLPPSIALDEAWNSGRLLDPVEEDTLIAQEAVYRTLGALGGDLTISLSDWNSLIVPLVKATTTDQIKILFELFAEGAKLRALSEAERPIFALLWLKSLNSKEVNVAMSKLYENPSVYKRIIELYKNSTWAESVFAAFKAKRETAARRSETRTLEEVATTTFNEIVENGNVSRETAVEIAGLESDRVLAEMKRLRDEFANRDERKRNDLRLKKFEENALEIMDRILEVVENGGGSEGIVGVAIPDFKGDKVAEASFGQQNAEAVGAFREMIHRLLLTGNRYPLGVQQAFAGAGFKNAQQVRFEKNVTRSGLLEAKKILGLINESGLEINQSESILQILTDRTNYQDSDYSYSTQRVARMLEYGIAVLASRHLQPEDIQNSETLRKQIGDLLQIAFNQTLDFKSAKVTVMMQQLQEFIQNYQTRQATATSV